MSEETMFSGQRESQFNSSSVIYTTHKRNRKHSYREQQALCGLLLFFPYRKSGVFC